MRKASTRLPEQGTQKEAVTKLSVEWARWNKNKLQPRSGGM